MKTIRILTLIALMTLTVQPFVRAGDRPPEDSEAKGNTCDTDASEYAHGALQFFHNQLCRLNVTFPGVAEEFLFQLVARLGMNPDTSSLAADGTATNLETKTKGDKTITGTVQKVVSPSTFAGVYDFQAILKVNDVTEVTLYWTGSKSDSKGFLIMGGQGFGKKKRLLYLKWDRTAEAQTVAVLGTRMDSSYLSNASSDDALYGKINYNTSTKATDLQMVHINKQRGGSGSPTLACFKMYAVGTIGGALRVGKTQNSLSTTGHSRTLATQDGIDQMDDWEGNDTKGEADGTGNGTGVQGFAMDYSCADVNSAGGTAKPFDGNTVDHDMTKTEMEAMFTTN